MHALPVTGAADDRSQHLASVLRSLGSVVVGFSGGVDSAFLAVSCVDVLGRDRVVAALGVSDSLAGDVHERAQLLARTFGIHLREVPTSELDDADYVANRGDRCFYCKRELWTRLTALARAERLACVVDGTIADDAGEHRPGARAGASAGVRSPLAECGYTKRDVRAAARARGIPIWDAPASPCLASRLAVGVAVSRDRLARIERAEAAVRALGVAGDMRVRDTGAGARVELPTDVVAAWHASPRVGALAAAVHDAGFDRVMLDRRGYRRGALQERRAADVIDITDGVAHDTLREPSA